MNKDDLLDIAEQLRHVSFYMNSLVEYKLINGVIESVNVMQYAALLKSISETLEK